MRNTILKITMLFIGIISILVPVNVHAGTTPDNLTSSEQDTVDRLHDYMMEQGYSEEAVCGVLGNLAVECNFQNITDNHHKGYFQFDDGLWYEFLNYAYENGYDTGDIISQFKFVEKYIERDIDAYTTYTIDDFKNADDVVFATELFMCAVERCVISWNTEENKLQYQDIIYNGYNNSYCGGQGFYQGRYNRVCYATEFYNYYKAVREAMLQEAKDENIDKMKEIARNMYEKYIISVYLNVDTN